ncbi:RHS repeat-associated core domain-containing protein [Mesonia aestuariivivens]|uniref:VCBS repeat-containing protein n=1 Tax=Mesonia aestuariivivens TaxID=2796128 RepID=A0ABS6W270_9FLAO|nr:RHS repeat-associated core domain-containing protein [Mesonia aestuariivivens]MBW2961951.1 VCBS repeat-containing protein [Mesonia aestuariivivens]
MKKILTSFGLFIICLNYPLFSQNNNPSEESNITGTGDSIILPNQLSNHSTFASSSSSSKLTSSTMNPAGMLNAELSVTSSGAAIYHIPFDLPKGIGDFKPDLGLTYNSQAGNGIAGWGWQISGLSSISRTGKTKFHNGVINNIKFDNDQFTLNGQRLMVVSGTYGNHNSIYQTENYSNLKIQAKGTHTSGSQHGPLYFIVHYPNGNKSYYGNSMDSRGKLEWLLKKTIDKNGNTIDYSYTGSLTEKYISKIMYGAKGSNTAPVEIKFNYNTRRNQTNSYIGGTFFQKGEILDNVEVNVNNELYRKYDLFYSQTVSQYQRLTYIWEYNHNNERREVRLVYDVTPNNLTQYTNSVDFIPQITSSSKASAGEFNGDGKMDLIFYDKNKLNLFTELFDSNSGVSFGYSLTGDRDFETVFPSKILNSQSKLLNPQAITTVTEEIKSANSEIEFNMYSLAAYGLIFQYQRTFNFPIEPGYNSGCSYRSPSVNRKIEKEFLSGDFNGDGLSDVLVVSKGYNKTICDEIREPYEQRPDCRCVEEFIGSETPTVYFIDLNQNLTSNNFTISGVLSTGVAKGDKFFTVDIDGDGKTDFVHFKNGSVRAYTINSEGDLELLYVYSSSSIDIENPILVGDFNADGNTDFITPIAEGSSSWRLIFSNGSGFNSYLKDFGLSFKKNWIDDSITDPLIYEYNYIAQDFTGDGRTDILLNQLESHLYGTRNGQTKQQLKLFVSQTEPNNSQITFYSHYMTTKYLEGNIRGGLSISYQSSDLKNNLGYGYLIPHNSRNTNNVLGFQFNRDHRRDVSLKRIENNGVIDYIEYSNLSKKNGDETYAVDYEEVYPYINTNISPNLKVVKNRRKEASGYVRKKLYRYKGGVFHAKGLGFLGFKEFSETNWYSDNSGLIWNINVSNPQLRGAIIHKYKANSPYYTTYITKESYTYQSNLSATKVFKISPSQVVTTNNLQNFTSTKTFSYDNYLNPIEVTRITPDIQESTQYNYSNNPSISSNYHVGRVLQQTQSSTLDGNTFTTEKNLFYNSNGSLSTIEEKGNNTEAITKSYEYDWYGNIIEKSLSAPGLATRTESFEYDSTGIFLINSVNIEGLEKNYTYNNFGNLISITDESNRTSTLEYDSWGRSIKEIDFLGNTVNYNYSVSNVNATQTLLKETDFQTGADKKEYFDAFGNLILQKELSINSNWRAISYKYNDLGRLINESEPYFGSSPSQWNTSEYDIYGRPIQNSLFTGKTIQTSYNGLRTTVDDGTKIKITTTDTEGNIKQVQDSGGTINYSYYGNGELKSSNYAGHTITISRDGWGRKTQMVDPSAGTYSYSYNLFGDILTETTPRGTTTYEYDSTGKVIFKQIVGEETDLMLDYSYDPDTKLLSSIDGLDAMSFGGEYYAYSYIYDQYNRLIEVSEQTPFAEFSKDISYNNKGQIVNEIYTTSSIPVGHVVVKIKNVYDISGDLVEIKDFNSNQSLWKLSTVTAKGPSKEIKLGNGFIKKRFYDNNNFLTQLIDENALSNEGLKLEYEFDHQTGNLLQRKNHIFNWEEHFSYDDLDRLTTISGDESFYNSYDDKGRIITNSQIGNYKYNTSTYQASKILLNNQGDLYYQQHPLQEITYNAFKKPVEIFEEGKGRVNFIYGPLGNRTQAYYGGLSENLNDRENFKYYSSIIPVEINGMKAITYIGGDEYSAPVIHVKKRRSSTPSYKNYHYLHRDYLGSIIAISNSEGEIVEKRHYNAWGEISKYQDSSGNTEFTHQNTLLSRGYTGHEHFFGVGLIHMNGRVYDPHTHRFLSPDNYIQDPYNTQSFNRFGYVWNNPLKYSDPNGEFIIAAIIIGAAVGAYFGGSIVNRSYNPTKWDWSSSGTYVGILGGALIGGLSTGAGAMVATSIGASSTVGFGGLMATAVGGTVGGAISGAGFAILQGENVFEGFWKGGVSGLIGGAVGSYIGGIGGAFSGGFSSSAFNAMIEGDNLGDIIKSGIIGGAISLALNHVQQRIAYSSYKNTGGKLTFKQFSKISYASQKSFARGEEYGGWILDDGSIEMWTERSGKNFIQPTKRPSNTIGEFHTHPNLGGNWIESHSPTDINAAIDPSYVIGRKNVWFLHPSFGGSPTNLYKSNLFHVYPYFHNPFALIN